MTSKPPFDVSDHIGPLRRKARALTRNGPDSEDLVQETILQAYEKAGSRAPDGNLRGWLMAILRNRFLDTRRRDAASARREAAVAELTPASTDGGQDMHMRATEVRAAFFSLPPEQRAALYLVAIEGRSCAEAAGMLGIPMGTLTSRLGRARDRLRALDADDSPRIVPFQSKG
ncbi:hypothetical protein ATO6_06785 [Oceanicola sp. 22II-s10i]|uniref:sigma-70 family RNA polymerase sigma factor n=1 Tax=Oceanicola sp. 22II-s10i TaxID=1317116 RepID=UPI000B522A2C|nr:sigma-70 family RNA polymerase sigma factor [Oceanicola sp. 22II-s10i]OWU86501.1 hypothetical protein ATO6_06785 [Oceanicola sp. 22II-s10i]